VPTPAARYLEDGYLAVRGMSSPFAARIIVALLARQTASGVRGHVAEIGVFEGRLLIAMALTLADGERALAIDHFAWPDPGVRGRFEANLAAHGVPAGRVVVRQGDSRLLTPRRLIAALGGPVRFFHVDGEHTAEHLAGDLRLAAAAAAPEGVVALDDMLHPGYPTLALTVHAFLDANQCSGPASPEGLSRAGAEGARRAAREAAGTRPGHEHLCPHPRRPSP
jgi:hypothetical protein